MRSTRATGSRGMSATSPPGTPQPCARTVRATSTGSRTRRSATRRCRSPSPLRREQRRAAGALALPAARLPDPRDERPRRPQRARPDRAARPRPHVRRGEAAAGSRASAARSARSTPRSGGGSVAPRRSGSRGIRRPPNVRVGFEVVAVEQGRLTADSRRPLAERVAGVDRREETGRDAAKPIAVAATQEALYRGARSRAVLVGGDAAGARADEARSPAPPVPRQVHPAARRDAARAARSGGRPRPRSVRRLGHDAGAGARVGLRRHRRRHRGLQRAARARQDAPVQPRRAAARPPLGARARRRRSSRADATRARRPPTCARGTRRRRRRSCSTSASLVEQVGSADVLARRARPVGPIRAADGPLRPRLPARAAARAVLVLQAPA